MPWILILANGESICPRPGRKSISPDYLRTYQPEVIIIMNPIYQAEIKQSVEDMGLVAHSGVLELSSKETYRPGIYGLLRVI